MRKLNTEWTWLITVLVAPLTVSDGVRLLAKSTSSLLFGGRYAIWTAIVTIIFGVAIEGVNHQGDIGDIARLSFDTRGGHNFFPPGRQESLMNLKKLQRKM